jgi:hypothetical protein
MTMLIARRIGKKGPLTTTPIIQNTRKIQRDEKHICASMRPLIAWRIVKKSVLKAALIMQHIVRRELFILMLGMRRIRNSEQNEYDAIRLGNEGPPSG